MDLARLKMNIKEKQILTCRNEELKGFTPNNTNEYVYYKGLGKGKILVVDVKTKEIDFSSKDLLKLIEGKYKVVQIMTSKEAKTHIIDTLNGDMNKECFINELLPEILKDLERLEQIEKTQDLEIDNLKFIDNENKYQVAIRVLKEAFIVLGKSDITNTCWFIWEKGYKGEPKIKWIQRGLK